MAPISDDQSAIFTNPSFIIAGSYIHSICSLASTTSLCYQTYSCFDAPGVLEPLAVVYFQTELIVRAEWRNCCIGLNDSDEQNSPSTSDSLAIVLSWSLLTVLSVGSCRAWARRRWGRSDFAAV